MIGSSLRQAPILIGMCSSLSKLPMTLSLHLDASVSGTCDVPSCIFAISPPSGCLESAILCDVLFNASPVLFPVILHRQRVHSHHGPLSSLQTIVPWLRGISSSMVKRRKDRTIRYHFDDEAGDTDDIGNAPDLASSSASVASHIHRHVDYSFVGRRPSVRTSYVTLEESAMKEARAEPINSASTAEPEPITSMFQDGVDLDYVYQELGASTDIEGGHQRRAGERPLLRWIPEIGAYLAELLRLEGRGDFTDGKCTQCGNCSATYRCEDCSGGALLCALCIVEGHCKQPLHRIQGWKEGFFHRTTLKSLGLRVQLGHEPGERCVNPKPAFGDDFVVLDVFGIHEVAVDFCSCEKVQPHTIQLLRARWYPATSIDPKTAATFRLLENFHLLSTQSKISGYEFYISLARATDNIGTSAPRDRYPAFMDMIRQWRHLKMLKRSGQGHEKDRAMAGHCAVECPACPLPGKNLPDDWQDAPSSRSWLYRLFLSMDANFRLKRKKVSNDASDPSLNDGRAYVVEENAYKEHLGMYAREHEGQQPSRSHRRRNG
ncbi:hypothetical protein NUW54_g8777 [Trametes sanguinea]|uniref:Uncharacterized protein n=1 Tax=Trametes sanguinea TaxID=158606 RepID=A0ACC1PC84_9APHY|nr:hypothetical protein NUW54_g8777 [Trametes sanguinea]